MPTILIVEDDPLNLRVFTKILSKGGGLEVRSTEDTEEVLRLARSGEIDAILMDVSLKHSTYQGQAVDGIKITQILKADPQTTSLPVILLTAHAMDRDRDNFLKQSRADGYIAKPIADTQQFIAQVREWAGRS
jgi:CheY-like chemotaxis protein